jgi:hypothetical protein
VALPPGRFEARHQAELDRITGHAECDRDSRGRGLGRKCRGGGARRGDHTHSTANEIGRQLRQAIVSAFRPAIFDRHVLAYDVPAVSEASPERRYELGPLGGGGGVEKPDDGQCSLLRSRRERPRCRAM